MFVAFGGVLFGYDTGNISVLLRLIITADFTQVLFPEFLL